MFEKPSDYSSFGDDIYAVSLFFFSCSYCFPCGVAMGINHVFNTNCVILDSDARPVIRTCSRFEQRRFKDTF